MPSPKAILADIHEYGLDPNVAHTKTHAHGRLARNISQHSIVDEQPLKVEPVVSDVNVQTVELTPEPQIENLNDQVVVQDSSNDVVGDVITQSEQNVLIHTPSLKKNKKKNVVTID